MRSKKAIAQVLIFACVFLTSWLGQWSFTANEENPLASDVAYSALAFSTTASLDRSLIAELEADYLREHRAEERVALYANGQRRFEQRTYPHEAAEKRSFATKDFANAAVAQASVAAAAAAGSHIEDDRALVLDGMAGNTVKALLEVGFKNHGILSPNVDPAVAHSLRTEHGASAWAGRLEDYLTVHKRRQRPPFRLVYLDHTGSVPRYANLLRRVVRSGAVADQSVIAACFSTKRGPRRKPRSWSAAHALHAVADVLQRSARRLNLRLQGCSMPGLLDYIYLPKRCPPRNIKQVSEGPQDIISDIVTAREQRDTARLARLLHDWSARNGNVEARKQGLVNAANEHSAAVLDLLGWMDRKEPRVLGAAFGTPSTACVPARVFRRPAGAPAADSVLGAVDHVPDACIRRLWSVSRCVLDSVGDSAQPTSSSFENLPEEGAPLIFNGSVLLYQTNMMFAAFRLTS
eukprot:TRINITY_DN93528_c0_g1_i1.p1 TRINITY_DN93528_c0_g1~~TRINITY_DN93528_c0_g1_i1.p1  ORF type:complete len:478 (-),score=24.64 TRINITY_DN93528_c0_g1_i1:105-1493(-)